VAGTLAGLAVGLQAEAQALQQATDQLLAGGKGPSLNNRIGRKESGGRQKRNKRIREWA
jgi:hypothetical protein